MGAHLVHEYQSSCVESSGDQRPPGGPHPLVSLTRAHIPFRSHLAIRRHWELMFCTFSFCWSAYDHLPTEEPSDTENTLPAESVVRGKRPPRASWPEALRAVREWLQPWMLLRLY